MLVVKIFNISYNALSLDEAVQFILGCASQHREKKIVVTPNVDHVVRFHKDEKFRGIVNNALLRLADGAPIVLTSRLINQALPCRVTGADLLPAVCEKAALSQDIKLFFLGGLPGVAEQAAQIINDKAGRSIVVGCYSPPFGFEHDLDECKKIVEIVNSSGANILFVGVGSPKQEYWSAEYETQLNSNVILCTGAAFDFLAGTQKRAPMILQKTGFEWLYRVIQEPKRMWKRYFVDDLYFFVLFFKEIKKKFLF